MVNALLAAEAQLVELYLGTHVIFRDDIIGNPSVFAHWFLLSKILRVNWRNGYGRCSDSC